MDASVAVRDPASHKGWRSVRSNLQLILVILAACAMDAGFMVAWEIPKWPKTFDGLPRVWYLLQASVVMIAPGILAARLASRGYPTSLRMCIRAVVAFTLGSAVGHWIVFWHTAYPGTEFRKVWPPIGYVSSLLFNTLWAVSAVGAMYWWRRETVIRQELHRTRMGLLALRADCAEAELLRLRTQIEPHFLFNTMATIVQMYQTDRAGAGRTLARLIDYMSTARVHMQRQEAVLGEELALTEGYLEIQRLRMGARLRYEIEVSPALRGNRIPPAALLTLVENAIKHGLSPRPGGGLLRVAAHRDGVWVALNVSDSGVGFRTTSGRGLGLANLRARILGLYGGEASLRLTGAEEGGVMATMRLPFGPPSYSGGGRMSRSALAQFDWPGWRADVVERLDRRSIGIASAWVAVFSMSLIFISDRSDASTVALRTLFTFSTVMVTLAVLAVALVAVARGIPPWVAYPAAGFVSFAIGSVLGLVIDPLRWLAHTPTPPLQAMIVGHLYFLSFLCPFAVLYVYASSATYDEKVLRALEAERAAEAERLAQQRLQIELATVDHDLVLRAMRLALTAPEREAGQTEALLEAVTAYLRVAQQRGSSEPGRIAAALAELRQACESRGREPAQHAIA